MSNSFVKLQSPEKVQTNVNPDFRTPTKATNVDKITKHASSKTRKKIKKVVSEIQEVDIEIEESEEHEQKLEERSRQVV